MPVIYTDTPLSTGSVKLTALISSPSYMVVAPITILFCSRDGVYSTETPPTFIKNADIETTINTISEKYHLSPAETQELKGKIINFFLDHPSTIPLASILMGPANGTEYEEDPFYSA